MQSAIETDMQPENSWNVVTDKPDQYTSGAKRRKLAALQLAPIKPLL